MGPEPHCAMHRSVDAPHVTRTAKSIPRSGRSSTILREEPRRDACGNVHAPRRVEQPGAAPRSGLGHTELMSIAPSRSRSHSCTWAASCERRLQTLSSVIKAKSRRRATGSRWADAARRYPSRGISGFSSTAFTALRYREAVWRVWLFPAWAISSWCAIVPVPQSTTSYPNPVVGCPDVSESP